MAISSDSMFHTINRDGAEKYIVVFTGDSSAPIQIYDLLGVEKTVAYGTLDEDLVFSEDSAPKDYIAGGTPREDIAAVTVADYTIVANRSKTVAMLPAAAPVHLPIALVTIPHGVSDQTYKVFVNGTEVASYTAGNSGSPETWRTTAIADGLYSDLAANLTTGWEISVDGSTVFIVNTAGDDFTFKVEDSWGNQAMIGIKESVRRFEDLPTTLPSGLDHDFDVVTVGGTGSHYAGYFNISVDGALKSRIHSEDQTRAQVATALYNQLVVNLLSNPLFRCSRDAENITIWRTDGTHSTITVSADGGGVISVVASTVIDFTNVVYAVKPDPTTQNGTYYVRWNTLANDGKTTSGNWEECAARGIATQFDATTLPHRLVRMPNGTFVFAPIQWEDRAVGDDISAPPPTFVGNEINDVVFFKNRLCLLAKGSTILSRAGEFFDFFPTTATDVLDDDPIDEECGSKQVAVLRYAVPFQSQLVLFSDQQQFSLSSGQATFTPKSASGDLATTVEVQRCEPVSVKANIYFASPSGDFTSIREMFVSNDTLITDSADVTAHCPTYVPANIKKLAACEGKETVFALSSDDPTSIYVYKFYWNGDQKAQSAWNKWTFSTEVLYMDVIDNSLYIFTASSEGQEITTRVVHHDAVVTHHPEAEGEVSFSYPTTSERDHYLTTFPFADSYPTSVNPDIRAMDGDPASYIFGEVDISEVDLRFAAAGFTNFLTEPETLELCLDLEISTPGDLITASTFMVGTSLVNEEVTWDTDNRPAHNGNTPRTTMVYSLPTNTDLTALTCDLRFYGGPVETTMVKVYGVFVRATYPSTGAYDEVTPAYDETVTVSSGALFLEKINLDTTIKTAGLPFRVLLDRQVVLSGAYNYSDGVTVFTAPYVVLATDRALNVRTKECAQVTPSSEDNQEFSVPGNWSGDQVIFGRPYLLDFRFSEFGMKSADPKVYNRAGRGQLRTMNLSFEDTMAFDVVVSTPGRADSTQRFRASIPVTGEKRFVTLGDTRSTRVSIRSDSHLPCKFGGASYETMYTPRAK